MGRSTLRLCIDWIILITGLSTFATGLVLLLCFHVGDGAYATAALGVGKILWVEVHRLGALVLLVSVVTHVLLNRRLFLRHLVRVVSGRKHLPINVEVVLYACFLAATVTGFVPWLFLDGSSPLLGPAVTGPLATPRHPWIDTHFVTSLLALVFVVHHTGHRWSRLTRRRRPLVQMP